MDRQFAAVTRHCDRGAATWLRCDVRAKISIGAWIHRRNELEMAWEGHLPRSTRNVNHPTLEWSTQHFQNSTVKLYDLIQEKHAEVSERNFAWFGVAAPTTSSATALAVWCGERTCRCPNDSALNFPTSDNSARSRSLRVPSSAARCSGKRCASILCQCLVDPSTIGCDVQLRRFQARLRLRLTLTSKQIGIGEIDWCIAYFRRCGVDCDRQ